MKIAMKGKNNATAPKVTVKDEYMCTLQKKYAAIRYALTNGKVVISDQYDDMMKLKTS